MNALRPFFVALQFLTRIPVRLQTPSETEIGRSLLMYPAVGLLIGAVLVATDYALREVPDFVRAALLLATWVTLTGALHLDGLSDTADAFVGGRGDRQRTLAIMKDPYCGPMGATAIVLVLLVKFAALVSAISADPTALLLAPLLARTAVVVLFATTDYVRPAGLGRLLTYGQTRMRLLAVSAGTIIAILLFTATTGWRATAATLLVFGVLRWRMQVRLGGTTGDTAGAMIELIEVAVLVSLFL